MTDNYTLPPLPVPPAEDGRLTVDEVRHFAFRYGQQCAEAARAPLLEKIAAMDTTIRALVAEARAPLLARIAELEADSSHRVHKKRDGLFLLNARGESRFMTWRERAAFWLLRGKLEIRP